MTQELIYKELNKLMNKAIKHNEVPVAAIIIKDNKIIAKSYNKVEHNNSVLNHAEINVIKKVNKKLKNWRLDDCELHITLEPCEMCKSIIKKSRIKKVFYYSKQNKYKTESNPNYFYIEYNYFSKQLSSFFKNKR